MAVVPDDPPAIAVLESGAFPRQLQLAAWTDGAILTGDHSGRIDPARVAAITSRACDRLHDLPLAAMFGSAVDAPYTWFYVRCSEGVRTVMVVDRPFANVVDGSEPLLPATVTSLARDLAPLVLEAHDPWQPGVVRVAIHTDDSPHDALPWPADLPVPPFPAFELPGSAWSELEPLEGHTIELGGRSVYTKLTLWFRGQREVDRVTGYGWSDDDKPRVPFKPATRL
jgi:hypothetical protein